MDSNHDIVPTLRMMDGVYTRLAADEIERLRARVALLERRADTSLIPGAEPTHRCKVCGAYWRKWNVDGEASWNLNSHGCGECCDNVAMGEQIEALASPAKVGGDVLTFDQAEQALCAAYGRGWRATAATFTSPTKVGGDEREADIDAHVIERFATILAEISLTLKGVEQPLQRHSYHDLPKLVAELKLEVDLHRANEARAALSADGDTQLFFDRQQAGFERCYEALGITDDRERSWSALILAITDALSADGGENIRKGKNGRWPRHIERAKRDAERWRYLREQHEGTESFEDAEGFVCTEPTSRAFTVFKPGRGDYHLEPVGCMSGELDATIDAAIAAKAKGKTS